MSTITVAQDILDARERLTPTFAALRDDMCGHFWETFGAAAARYRSARNEGQAAREFAGIVRELERDAQGSLVSFPREIPTPAEREAWATMPTDGSHRVGRFAGAVYTVVLAVFLVVLGWVGALVWEGGAAVGTPAVPAAATVTPDGATARAQMVQGAMLSWWIASECGEGPQRCDAALREANANGYGVRFFEDGTAFDPTRH